MAKKKPTSPTAPIPKPKSPLEDPSLLPRAFSGLYGAEGGGGVEGFLNRGAQDLSVYEADLKKWKAQDQARRTFAENRVRGRGRSMKKD